MAIFNRLSDIYAEKWTEKFAGVQEAEIAIAEWAEALHGLTSNEIASAIVIIKREYSWPPSIAEFYQAARPKKDNGFRERKLLG